MYVAVKGGERAIDNANRLLAAERRGDPAVPELTLAQIREQLGLPDTGRLRATLDKLTIYGPGEFFAPHQDTEKDDDMIATLVVLLPSSFGGGALRCSRGDEQVEFRRTERGAAGGRGDPLKLGSGLWSGSGPAAPRGRRRAGRNRAERTRR